MNRIAALVFVAWASVAAASANFPQMALGGGYEVVLLVSNKLDREFSGFLVLQQGNYASWEGAITVNGEPADPDRIDVDLPARGATRLLIKGDDTLRAGFLTVWGTGENFGGDILVTFFYNLIQGGKLVDSTGIPNSGSLTRTMFSVEKSMFANTGFAWARAFPGAASFDVTLKLYDEAGNEVRTKTLTYDGHLSKFFDEVFDNVPEEFVGQVRIEAPEGLLVTVLRIEYVDGSFQLTSTPATVY